MGQPIPVGAWAEYRFEQPGKPKAKLRYAVVAGDAEGNRRYEIEIDQAGRKARFGYDVAPDGSRSRQVAQLGDRGPVLLFPPVPEAEGEPRPFDTSSAPKTKGKPQRVKRTVPAGTFDCDLFNTVAGKACVQKGLMPMQLVEFKGADGQAMVLIDRGFDARPRMLGKPVPAPRPGAGGMPTMVPQGLPIQDWP